MASPGAVPGASGTLYVGTSGFSYPAWAPRFYPPGTRSGDLLAAYGARLSCCELNNTFYRHPTETAIAAWCAATPAAFRFAVKAQRGGSLRALMTDPAGTVAWLTAPYRHFGGRLGCVLFRVPAEVRRDDARLATLLAAWPRDLPLTVECRDPSWAVDEVFDLLRGAGAAWCSTDLDEDPEPPSLRLTGSSLYVRLRRAGYTEAELEVWADRLVPFLDAGRDAYVVFRHDDDGTSPLRALRLAEMVAARRDPTPAKPRPDRRPRG
jgi:uncharacterized protein YecE (DUF72 family)